MQKVQKRNKADGESKSHAINIKYSSQKITSHKKQTRSTATRAKHEMAKNVKRYQEIKEQMDTGHD